MGALCWGLSVPWDTALILGAWMPTVYPYCFEVVIYLVRPGEHQILDDLDTTWKE